MILQMNSEIFRWEKYAHKRKKYHFQFSKLFCVRNIDMFVFSLLMLGLGRHYSRDRQVGKIENYIGVLLKPYSVIWDKALYNS